HFDGAAGQAKGHGPDRVLADPVDGRVQGSKKNAVRLVIAVINFTHLLLILRAALERPKQIPVLRCSAHISTISWFDHDFGGRTKANALSISRKNPAHHFS